MKSGRFKLIPFLLVLCILFGACSKDNGISTAAASGNTAGQESVSQEAASADTEAPEESLSENGTEDEEAKAVTDGEESSGGEALSENTVSDNTLSDNTVSADSASENAAVSGNGSSSGNNVAEKEADLSRVTEWEKPVTMYAQARVNIRKGPAVSFQRVGELMRGEETTVIGQDADGWYEILRGGQICFVCNSYPAENLPAAPTPVPEPEQPVTQPAPTAAPTPAPAPVVSAPAGVVIVGDSRCVGMREATGGGGVSWICENSKEYEWFKGTAIPQLDAIVGRGTKVVICMGVNDTDHAYSYAPLINQKAAEWAARGARTYFVSVNPVGDNPYTNMDNVVN